MVKDQKRKSVVQPVLFVLLCLMVFLAGGVFILDQGRSPYHVTAIPVPEPITVTPLSVAYRLLDASDDPGADLSPAVALHRLHSETKTGLDSLVHTVFGAFDDTSSGRALESYLVWAIRSGKPDAYVDSLLNSAAAKGHFQMPSALTTLSGRLDTQSLLRSVLVAAKQDRSVPITNAHVPQQHLLHMSDSLAGLSLAYNGNPLDHTRIAEANGTINRLAKAKVGQVFEIPGL